MSTEIQPPPGPLFVPLNCGTPHYASTASVWHRYLALYGERLPWREPTAEEAAAYHAENARIAALQS